MSQSALPAEPARPTYSLTAKFSVLADADPNVTSRLLELFALRGLVPLKVSSSRFNNGTLVTRILVNEISESDAHVLASKLRQCVMVSEVGLEFQFSAARSG